MGGVSDDLHLRFPIGRFERPDGPLDPATRAAFIADIEALPQRLRDAVAALGPGRLDAPYRPGGWTGRQVVHHLPDSHLNAYVRFKLTLTESSPTIRPYDEGAWAELPDGRLAPPEISLGLLDALHRRWSLVLRNMDAAAFSRVYVHPEFGHTFTLDTALALYSWHGRHHTAHVRSLRG